MPDNDSKKKIETSSKLNFNKLNESKKNKNTNALRPPQQDNAKKEK